MVLNAAVATRKPVVACLLGYAGKTPDGVRTATTLEEAAVVAVGLAGREVAAIARPPATTGGARGAVRGLYAGGTLCDEARRIVTGARHHFTDFGAEEYTRGRPHPIIDPGRRHTALVEAGGDPSVSVILLDLVLGDCAHPDPAGALRPAFNEARARRSGRGLALVAHVVGTDQDPQGLEKQEQGLRDLGAIVCVSNRIAAEDGPDARRDGPCRLSAICSTSRRRPSWSARSSSPRRWSPRAFRCSGSTGGLRRGRRARVALVRRGRRGESRRARSSSCRPPDPRRRSSRDRCGAGHDARDTVLHAGPPISWDRMSGPMRGGIVGALIYEALATAWEDAERLVTRGAIRFDSCHHHATVGPMAGATTASMPVLVVENHHAGNRAYSTLNEGLGKVLRYGAYSPDVIDRLRWFRDVVGPALGEAVRRAGGVDLRALIAQAVQMGDECHNRNRAASALLIKALAPEIAGLDLAAAERTRILAFAASNEHLFLNVGMAACKAAMDPAHGVPHSTLVTAMARNGTEFGIRVSGLGDRWFTGPAGTPQGLYFPGFGPGDANPDIGDSAITETAGLGGFAMGGAPPSSSSSAARRPTHWRTRG
mgnify:CR=1 FL=1